MSPKPVTGFDDMAKTNKGVARVREERLDLKKCYNAINSALWNGNLSIFIKLNGIQKVSRPRFVIRNS